MAALRADLPGSLAFYHARRRVCVAKPVDRVVPRILASTKKLYHAAAPLEHSDVSAEDVNSSSDESNLKNNYIGISLPLQGPAFVRDPGLTSRIHPEMDAKFGETSREQLRRQTVGC